jgi:phosphate transport system substrate-binding protein
MTPFYTLSFSGGRTRQVRAVNASIVGFLVFGLLAGTTTGALAQQVTGAGATFPAPLYARWADAYNKATGVRVNYQSVGSGAGLRQIRGKTVDFGASDMPLKDDVLVKDGLFQFPTVIGGVVPVVNLAGIKPGQLRLTGQVLADLFLGKIKRWNDPALQALNPDLKLPDARVTVIRRADGSGTTFIFTNYLSKVSAEWKERVGDGTAVKWPTDAGGKGNEGVAAFVQRLPNSIGYVEYSFARQNRLTYATLKNAAGNFVTPNEDSFKAAAVGADWKKSFHQILTNQPGKDAWPVTGATFIVMHLKQDKPGQAQGALRFFDWAFANGDPMAESLDYIPLPPALEDLVRQQWGKVTDTTGKAVTYR